MTAHEPHRAHFHELGRDQQAAAIRRLAAQGMTDYGLAHATSLAVEQIRQILGDSPDRQDAAT